MVATGQKNYYDLLGIGRNASLDEIRAAYARKIEACIPTDEDGEPLEDDEISGETQALLKVVTAAFATLSNYEKRAEYDRLLPQTLRTWDEDEFMWGQGWAAKKILTDPENSPYAFGTFGVTRDKRIPPSAFDLLTEAPRQPEKRSFFPRRGLLESLRALVRLGR